MLARSLLQAQPNKAMLDKDQTTLQRPISTKIAFESIIQQLQSVYEFAQNMCFMEVLPFKRNPYLCQTV